MIPESITLTDLARAVLIPVDKFRRLCKTSDRTGSDQQVFPSDVLLMGLAGATLRAVPGMSQEGLLGLFLKEIRNCISPLAYTLEDLWAANNPEAEIPDFPLGFAENEFVTWPTIDNFYQLRTGVYVEQLPMPAAWATTLHPAAIYFRVRNVLKEIEDAHRTRHAAESVDV